MTDTTALKALLAKVDAGELSPRRLDAEVDAVLRIGTPTMAKPALWAYKNFPTWQAKEDSPGFCQVVHDNGEGGLWWKSAHFTTSPDAAKALHESVLPDWQINLASEANGNGFVAQVSAPDWDSYSAGHSHELARAWLIAIIKALIAQEASE